MVIAPIAPHLTALKSLVLGEESRVRLINRSYGATVLTVDGQVDLVVEPNGSVDVTVAAEASRFARRGARSEFYHGLSARLTRG
jgi:NAD kinase